MAREEGRGRPERGVGAGWPVRRWWRGGGGGGGLFGGGGGGGLRLATSSPTTGGGGGGGSNLLPGGGTATVSDSGPSVTISYQGEGCWTNAAGAGGTTCRFLSTGSQETFMTPAGVSSIHVMATGAPGAMGTNGGTVGRGAQVSGDVTVTPGQSLYVNVEETGEGSRRWVKRWRVKQARGVGSGGGGGGATDLRTVSSTQPGSLPSRLIVAAGGGGTGQGASLGGCEGSPITTTGGNGGDAGSDGGQGPPGGDIQQSRLFGAGRGRGRGHADRGRSRGGDSSGGWPTVFGNVGSLGQGGDGGNSDGNEWAVAAAAGGCTAAAAAAAATS